MSEFIARYEETRLNPLQARLGVEQFYPYMRDGIREALVKTCANPFQRQNLLAQIDRKTHVESETLKRQPYIFTDMFIVGTGPHATAFAQQIRHANPEISVLFGEKEETRGGHFRGGKKPYTLNSPNKASSSHGFKYEKGEPNDLGSHALIHSRDISSAIFPESDDQGAVNTINNFHVAPSLMGTRILTVEKNTTDKQGLYKITAMDEKTKRQITVYTNVVVGALGLGEPNKDIIKNASDNILTFQEFLQDIERYKTWPMSYRLSQGIGIIGGADSALVTLEKLIDLRLKDHVPLGPITIYGVDFENAEEFEEKTIERYKHLSKYFPSRNPLVHVFPGIRINLVKKHATSVTASLNRVNIKEPSSEESKSFGTVILSLGYRNTKNELFGNFDPEKNLKNVFDREIECVVGQQIQGENIFFVGPAANISYSSEELAKIPKNMQGRYLNSLRRLTPRTERLAEKVGTFYSSRLVYRNAA